MKRYLLIFSILSLGYTSSEVTAQTLAIKSNLLYDLTTTMNLGVEVGLSRQWTLDVPVNYNPWKLHDGARLRHWAIQPEVRYWFCEKFRRTFIGLHAHYADFNVGNWPDLPLISQNMQNARYQGSLYGAGIAIGHSWIIRKRWSIEASFGMGYTHIEYDKFPCTQCGTKIKEDSKNFFGPTKASVSLIYMIK